MRSIKSDSIKIFLVGMFSATLFLSFSVSDVRAVTCQAIAGGAEEYLCTPRTTPYPTGCGPEDGGGMICEGIIPTAQGTITVTPENLKAGEVITLRWETTGATDCSISNTYSVKSSGVLTFVPPNSGAYFLYCKGVDSAGNTGGTRFKVANTKPITIEGVDSEGAEAPTETINTNLLYVPLEPFVGVNQGGSASFGELIKGYFGILVNIGAFLAVVVLVVGGITYMVSESTVSKFVGKERVKAAFIGLGILAAAWLILNTINPQLLTFDRDLLAPAGPSVVERKPGLDRDGVVTKDLSNSQLKALNKKYNCHATASGGNTCIIDQKVLIFDPEKKNTQLVNEQIEEFRKYCEDGLFSSLRGWRVKRDVPSSIFGVSGMSVHICKLG